MAKRFTDTSKYRKAWFRALPPRLKCAWDFLCLECDHAGIWSIDIDSLAFHIGEAVSLNDILTNFEVTQIASDKLFIPGFIEFQYGCLIEDLNPENKVHCSVILVLKKLGVYKGLPSPMQGTKDKDKDKDKEKDKEKEKTQKFDFQAIYARYPRKDGRAEGIKRCKAVIKTVEDYDRLKQAVERYRAQVERDKTEKQFMKHFSSFMSGWDDWLDPETGSATVNAPEDRYAFLKNSRHAPV